jgi:hypothetical protein
LHDGCSGGVRRCVMPIQELYEWGPSGQQIAGLKHQWDLICDSCGFHEVRETSPFLYEINANQWTCDGCRQATEQRAVERGKTLAQQLIGRTIIAVEPSDGRVTWNDSDWFQHEDTRVTIVLDNGLTIEALEDILIITDTLAE